MQISRTPLEKDFLCVGVPPKDLLLDVMEEVARRRRICEDLLDMLQNNGSTEDLRTKLQECMDMVDDSEDWQTVKEKCDTSAHSCTTLDTTQQEEQVRRTIGLLAERGKSKYDIDVGLETMCTVTNTYQLNHYTPTHHR